MAAVTTPGERRGHSLVRWTVLVAVGLYLLLPLLAMLEFSTRGPDSGRTLDAWKAMGTDSELLGAITVSLELALLSVAGVLVLLVPTMTWVHLRVPRLRRLIEAVCLLPLTIPAIVLVVGLAPIYAWINYLFGNSALTLTFVYIVLVLPYAHRAIDAGLASVDIVTLAEAARSLGSSWTRVLLRIVVPNIRGAITSASVICVALVLGEFTISSLLNFDTLQVVINLLGKRDAAVSVAVSFAALVFAFVLLLVLAGASRRHRESAPQDAVKGSVP
ncbi:ABC transporter permease subunit [Streptomyces sp. HNM0575]|uniref:ABC transporter permease n=1 Tax=Streptomyces sp. HNM0575 TaxID=2716338 RepID=UPI00145C869A|nr:ABC transporter permease subunit [Streptomyces sp. HNM0575]NLU74393.1 ABC transporter permease subunit [Streptomyces sp. HNM0575]